MARTNAWWAHSETLGTTMDTVMFDLLTGSSLAVEGATVRRCLGTMPTSVFAALGHRKPIVRFGLLVGQGFTGAELDPVNWNDHAWFYLTEQSFDEPLPGPGVQVFTTSTDTSGSWDVAVNRVLGVGDSLWLLATVLHEQSAESRNYRVFARTLVTSPT